MPTIPEAFAIAVQQHNEGQLGAAEQIFAQILAVEPGHAQASHHLGLIALQRGNFELAISCISRAIELDASEPTSYCNLGSVLQALGRLDEAARYFQLAIERNPNFAEAYNNLAVVFQSQEKRGEAFLCFQKALELKPDYAEAYNNLGSAFQVQGEVDHALACFQCALELKPDYVEASSNLLLALQYRPGISLVELASAHAQYEQLHAAALRVFQRSHGNDRDPNRPIRIGFISPDLGRHAVGYFLIRVVENLDAQRCQLICYNDRAIRDDFTVRFQEASKVWREVKGKSDEEVAELVRADAIDILFDLAGHTEGNRLRVFARQPAPIQITWAGYTGTTGLKAMDFILADRYEITPEAEAFYSERVLRMPGGYVCYEAPADAPAVSPLPAYREGFLTFGSFNNPAKINLQVIQTWAEILRRLPQSRLVLKYRAMDDVSVAGRIAREFAASGVDPERVKCSGWSSHRDLLAEYNSIDVALDTFPYSGGLTTCEALWMGVPVITCPGETFASRHSLSHLSNVGRTETIAHDLVAYVELAVRLGEDLSRLAELRAELREKMAASPLCDGQQFAERLMELLRRIWGDWCRSRAGD